MIGGAFREGGGITTKTISPALLPFSLTFSLIDIMSINFYFLQRNCVTHPREELISLEENGS